jgi:ABC-type branched-subunit amino acid transport system ATPase component
MEARNLKKSFGGLNVLLACSLRIEPGELTALIGPNGSGKTTLLNILNGFITPDSGFLALPASIARAFQTPRVFSELSVYDNLAIAVPAKNESPLRALLFPGDMHRAFVENMARFLGLGSKLRRPAASLSFGERRLLTIGRTVLQNKEAYFFDEPVSGLHQSKFRIVAELLKELRAQGKLVLFIEHNPQFVELVADRVLKMEMGRIK